MTEGVLSEGHRCNRADLLEWPFHRADYLRIIKRSQDEAKVR